jgi:hypothetical protein
MSAPANIVPIDKNGIDVIQVFTTWVAFMGDADKTAVALDLDPVFIKNLATIENWQAKLKAWNDISTGDPREVQVQINRAINFVQAHRLRTVLDKVTGKLHAMTPDQLIEALTVPTKYGSEVKTRALTDLVKAAETVQLMSCRALGDTVGERPGDEGKTKGSEIMLSVAKAMQAADSIGLDSAEVIRKQLAIEATPPTNPNEKLP